MNHRALVGLLVLTLTSLGSESSRSQSTSNNIEADQLIKRVESRYGRMRGLAADFEQKYLAPGMRERREHGHLILLKPRRMRWEYKSNPAKLFIVSGRDVWLYVPTDREATHATIDSVSDARFPFLFLLGQTNLRREFRSISLMAPSSSSETSVLRLVPRKSPAELREILLEVYPDGRILRIKTVDQTGASSEVTLKEIRENFVAPLDAFEFRPPPGVTVRTQR